MRRLALIIALAFVATMPQPAVRAEDRPATADTSRSSTSVLQRVAVVGASASSGFGARVDLTNGTTVTMAKADFATVLDATLTGDHEPVVGHASMLFFRNPTRAGPSLCSGSATAPAPGTTRFAANPSGWS